MENPLLKPVESFILAVAAILTSLADELNVGDREKLADDVALEAFNLAAAFIDSDGVQTDDELWAFIGVFARRFDTVANAGHPTGLRIAGLLSGKRTFLDSPSPLYDLLVRADAKRGTTNSWRYYERALEIATAVLAIDDVPTHGELTAVERFRSMLLRTMDKAGVRRPGSARPDKDDKTTRMETFLGGPLSGPVGGPLSGPGTPGAPATGQPTEEGAPPELPPLPPPRPLDELLAELESLVGLAAVKAEVKLVTNLIRVQKMREERKLPVVEASHHLVFTGNPGTGKTTVARLVAQIYRTLGVVDRGHLVETDRSGLVAGYIGQTAIKVKEVFETAMGGILLIDEAHALARGEDKDFGREAIDMIVKLMEDHRDDIVLIVAGYPAEMATFLDANPGLRSRFPKTIFFEDYTNDELLKIFDGMCKKSSYTPTEDARKRLLDLVTAQPRTHGFGNARLVRNLFEAAVARQASRVVDIADVTDQALVTLEASDIPEPEAANPS